MVGVHARSGAARVRGRSTVVAALGAAVAAVAGTILVGLGGAPDDRNGAPPPLPAAAAPTSPAPTLSSPAPTPAAPAPPADPTPADPAAHGDRPVLAEPPVGGSAVAPVDPPARAPAPGAAGSSALGPAGAGAEPAADPAPGPAPGPVVVPARAAGGTLAVATPPAPVAGTPCTEAARACVDLAGRRAWLIDDGVVARGPVPVMAGDRDTPTPRGTFSVEWKAEQWTSREYLVQMPYSVFFAEGGIAFHEGRQDTFSAGCVKLVHDDAVAWFAFLQVGDQVQVR